MRAFILLANFFLKIVTSRVANNNSGSIVHDGNSGMMLSSRRVNSTNASSVSSSTESLITSTLQTNSFVTLQLLPNSAPSSVITAKAEAISTSV